MFSHNSPRGGSVKVLQNRSQFSQKMGSCKKTLQNQRDTMAVWKTVFVFTQATLGDSVSTSQEVTEARGKKVGVEENPVCAQYVPTPT